MNNIDLIVNFCENMVDCRRALQLNYFGEYFTREQCLMNRDTACDNCSRASKYKEIDATEISRACVKAVQELCMAKGMTVLQMVEVFKGAETKFINDRGLRSSIFHGRLKDWERSDIQRIFHKLVTENYLREEIIIFKDIPQAYIKIGSKVAKLMNDTKAQVMFAVMEKNQPKIKRMDVTAVDDPDDLLRDKCYHDVMEVATRIAEENNLTVQQVMRMETLKELSKKMPESEEDMLKITHITKAVFDKFGQRFLNVTATYAIQRMYNTMDAEADSQEKSGWSDADDEPEGTSNWDTLGRQASTSQASGGSAKRKSSFGNFQRRGAKRFRTSSKGAKRKSPKKAARGAPAKTTRGGTKPNLLPRPKPQF